MRSLLFSTILLAAGALTLPAQTSDTGTGADADEAALAADIYKLGVQYMSGDGVPRNETIGFRRFLAAAKRGNVEAQLAVAYCYAKGRGTTRDATAAVLWEERAAAQGNAAAQYAAGTSFFNGTGTTKNIRKALRYYRAAKAQQGVAKRDEAIAKKADAAIQYILTHENLDDGIDEPPPVAPPPPPPTLSLTVEKVQMSGLNTLDGIVLRDPSGRRHTLTQDWDKWFPNARVESVTGENVSVKIENGKFTELSAGQLKFTFIVEGKPHTVGIAKNATIPVRKRPDGAYELVPPAAGSAAAGATTPRQQ
ncbi:MAG: hypothetical protein LBR07_06880 [Puniceicoccales bacterium]|jgi:hypothetical protein|nr:hypothetical protein [Puniceicoccales bacterium]